MSVFAGIGLFVVSLVGVVFVSMKQMQIEGEY
jgi:hypothetical protein